MSRTHPHSPDLLDVHFSIIISSEASHPRQILSSVNIFSHPRHLPHSSLIFVIYVACSVVIPQVKIPCFSSFGLLRVPGVAAL